MRNNIIVLQLLFHYVISDIKFFVNNNTIAKNNTILFAINKIQYYFVNYKNYIL